jgi:hypothetical protein
MDNFIIASEGLAYNNAFFKLKHIFNLAFPDKNIIYDIEKKYKPNLILRSHFLYEESVIDAECPYICWSGEPYRCNFKYKPPLCELNSYIPIIKNNDDYNSLELYEDPGMISNRCKSVWGNQCYYLTPHIKSFWVPYIIFCDYNLDNIRQYNNLDEKLLICGFISSNPTQKIRNNLFIEIKKLDYNNSIRSLGSVLNTENNILIDKKVDLVNFYKQFKFVMAIENSYHDGYITEKIMLPFMAGSIPIYYGSNKIKELFNDKSFFYVNDYLHKGWSLEDIALEIFNLANNDNELTGWKKYLKEPIFNNNIIPDILKIKEANSIIAHQIANYIKHNYNKYI